MPAPGHEVGRQNYTKVKKYFREHLCASQIECAKTLNLSIMAVGRHVKKIRAEWEGK